MSAPPGEYCASACAVRERMGRCCCFWVGCWVGWLVVGGCWLLVENDAYTQMEYKHTEHKRNNLKSPPLICNHIHSISICYELKINQCLVCSQVCVPDAMLCRPDSRRCRLTRCRACATASAESAAATAAVAAWRRPTPVAVPSERT